MEREGGKHRETERENGWTDGHGEREEETAREECGGEENMCDTEAAGAREMWKGREKGKRWKREAQGAELVAAGW